MQKGLEYVEKGVKVYEEKLLYSKQKLLKKLADELKADVVFQSS